MSAQGRSGAGGDGGDRGRMPRDMKDLLKICAEASSTNPDQDEVHSFDRMSPERKEWLENALNDMTTDPVARMKDCILKIRDSGTEEDHSETVEVALEELIEWTEHIDFAIDFHKIGGFEILDQCVKHDSSDVRSLCLELIATLVQNNPYCQAAVLEAKLLPTMLNILDNDDASSAKTKALYAISCLTRDVEAAQKVFTENDGFSVLMRAMQTDVEKLKIKSAFMLSSMVVDKPEFKDILCNMGMIDQFVGHLCEEHSAFHEHLMSALLAIVSDHPRSVSECLRPELRTVDLLKGRQKQLQGDDRFREELEYTNKMLEILLASDGQDVNVLLLLCVLILQYGGTLGKEEEDHDSSTTTVATTTEGHEQEYPHSAFAFSILWGRFNGK